jgi:DNA repair protein RadC
MGTSIAQIAAADRPRERLDRLGPEVLTDVELLALVLRSGGRDLSALELATGLLAEYGGLEALSKVGAAELACKPHMGPAKASSLRACYELARRLMADAPASRPQLREPADAVSLVRPYLETSDRERCAVIILSKSHKVLRIESLTVGTPDRCLLCVRDVLATVLRFGGASFVLAHNHPSGDARPSPEDRRITNELTTAATAVGLKMLDHVVIAGKQWWAHSLESDT